jgi:hypothetical protein
MKCRRAGAVFALFEALDEVPVVEINRAVERKRAFIANPAAHTFIGALENAQAND